VDSLELVSEWEIAGGGASMPTRIRRTSSITHLRSRIMKIADEEREVHAGDLVYTPPDTPHSIWPASVHAPIRGLAFAIGTPGSGKVDYS